MTPVVLTPDTRSGGTVRAFAPRDDRTHWACRGRLVNTTRPITRHTGKTIQCGRRLDPSWRWCPKCGALLAWNGFAIYNGVTLAHLERTPAVKGDPR